MYQPSFLNQAKEDNQKAKQQKYEAERQLENLKISLSKETELAKIAAEKISFCNHEVETLRNVLNFNKKVHEAQLNNLRNQLYKQQNSNTIYEELNSRDGENYEIDIKSVLSIFRAEYLEILEKAYNQEKNELIYEINELETKLKRLDIIAQEQRDRIDFYNTELINLNNKKDKLEREAVVYKNIADEESKSFESKRDEILFNIKNTMKKTRLLESELNVLVREDNEAVKLIIQLQLEINAYKTLMEIEDSESLVSLEKNNVEYLLGELI